MCSTKVAIMWLGSFTDHQIRIWIVLMRLWMLLTNWRIKTSQYHFQPKSLVDSACKSSRSCDLDNLNRVVPNTIIFMMVSRLQRGLQTLKKVLIAVHCFCIPHGIITIIYIFLQRTKVAPGDTIFNIMQRSLRASSLMYQCSYFLISADWECCCSLNVLSHMPRQLSCHFICKNLYGSVDGNFDASEL